MDLGVRPENIDTCVPHLITASFFLSQNPRNHTVEGVSKRMPGTGAIPAVPQPAPTALPPPATAANASSAPPSPRASGFRTVQRRGTFSAGWNVFWCSSGDRRSCRVLYSVPEAEEQGPSTPAPESLEAAPVPARRWVRPDARHSRKCSSFSGVVGFRAIERKTTLIV